MTFTRNLSSNERTIRLIVGILLLTWAIAGLGFGSVFGFLIGVAGAVLVGTSIISYCPVYQKLDMNSYRG